MALIVGVSGKIGSGKDYLADKLIEELERRGHSTTRTSFAKALKTEVTNFINDIKAHPTKGRDEMVEDLAPRWSMPKEHAGWLIDLLLPDIDLEDFDGWTRTLSVRSALQIHGTEIRRAQQPDYWTQRFLEEVNSHTDDNMIVFVTDGRFHNEIDCVIDNGGIAFRLDIPEEILEERRTGRDGIVYTAEQLNHISETALDDYQRFDYYVGSYIEPDFLSDIVEMRLRLR